LNILITGVSGFVGGHLVKALSTPEQALYGLDLNAPGDSFVSEEGGAVIFHPVDLSQPGQAERVLREIQPDGIYHLAAISSVPSAEADPLPALQSNVRGTVLLLDAVARHCPECRVLFVSSSEVYGRARPEEMPLVETAPVRPTSVYAVTKREGELWCEFYHRIHELDVVILRPFNHIGPGQSARFAASNFARQIAEIEAGRREAVLHVGNLDAERDFTDVRDVVQAYRLAVKRAPAGAVLNVCSGRAVSIREILDFYLSGTNTKIQVQIDSKRLRPSDQPKVRGSHEKLNQLTGWRPTISLEDSLRSILEFWRKKTKE